MVEHALIPIGVYAQYSGEELTVKTIMVRDMYPCVQKVNANCCSIRHRHAIT